MKNQLDKPQQGDTVISSKKIPEGQEKPLSHSNGSEGNAPLQDALTQAAISAHPGWAATGWTWILTVQSSQWQSHTSERLVWCRRHRTLTWLHTSGHSAPCAAARWSGGTPGRSRYRCLSKQESIYLAGIPDLSSMSLFSRFQSFTTFLFYKGTKAMW